MGDLSFNVVNNIAQINGNKGVYDKKVDDPSVKYGRNACDNFKKYIDAFKSAPKDLGLPDIKGLKDMKPEELDKKLKELEDALKKSEEQRNSTPPLKFAYKYLPGNVDYKNLDKKALLGNAYEELGKRTSVKVEDLTKELQTSFGKKADAKALDINENGEIDLGEYATTILVSDMYSKDKNSLNAENITGTITSEGQMESVPYISSKNYDMAHKNLSAIHKAFNLGEATKEFMTNPNNIAE